MEPQTPTPLPLEAQLMLLSQKVDYLVDEARKSARARKITFWASMLIVVLPLLGIVTLLPMLLDTLTGANTLGI